MLKTNPKRTPNEPLKRADLAETNRVVHGFLRAKWSGSDLSVRHRSDLGEGVLAMETLEPQTTIQKETRKWHLPRNQPDVTF